MQCTFLSIFSGQRQHWVKMCRTSSTLFASYSTRHFPDLQSERKYSELSSTGNFQTTRDLTFFREFPLDSARGPIRFSGLPATVEGRQQAFTHHILFLHFSRFLCRKGESVGVMANSILGPTLPITRANFQTFYTARNTLLDREERSKRREPCRRCSAMWNGANFRAS